LNPYVWSALGHLLTAEKAKARDCRQSDRAVNGYRMDGGNLTSKTEKDMFKDGILKKSSWMKRAQAFTGNVKSERGERTNG